MTRIEKFRKQIADGTFETPARIDGTVEVILPAIHVNGEPDARTEALLSRIALSAADMHAWCCLIAKRLCTYYIAKNHGGYDIYEDERIIISYDTYYPNVEVEVRDVGIVFSCSGHYPPRPSLYRSGAWIEYVRTLHVKAVERHVNKEREAIRKREEQHQRQFGSVDDAAVFSEHSHG